MEATNILKSNKSAGLNPSAHAKNRIIKGWTIKYNVYLQQIILSETKMFSLSLHKLIHNHQHKTKQKEISK